MNTLNASPSLALMYHRFGSPLTRSIVRSQYVLPAVFRAQLTMLLRAGYRPNTLREVIAQPANARGCFVATFDDGYASMLRLAYPILAEYQAPATVFAVVGCLGKTNRWDECLGDCSEPLLNKADLRALDTLGVEIAAHSMTHAHLTTLSEQALRRELVDAKQLLEDLLGKAVPGFAYPYGEWDARVREAVIAAGYQYAVITTRGAVGASGDVFTTPRVNITWNTVGPLLRLKLHQVYHAPGCFVPKPYREA